MKYTKLTIIQKVLSSIDSESVTSSDETVESEQVAELLESNYNEILMMRPWPHLYQTTSLEITETLNILKIPNSVIQIDWVRYNKEEIRFISYDDMISILHSRDTSEDNVDTNGAYTDRDPVYWTSIDDTHIIFDSYNESLQSSLSLCKSVREPNTLDYDTDVPDMPSRFHPVLLNAVLRDAFIQLKGDDSAGMYYENRFKDGLVRMVRWAKQVNKEFGPGFAIDYSRRVPSTTRIINTGVIHDNG